MNQAGSGPDARGAGGTPRKQFWGWIPRAFGKITGRTGGEEGPAKFEKVLQTELEEIRERREKLQGEPAGAPPGDLVGLAFSGGGIRSATICLGALQALHKLNLLRVFDYLSTVSGGGFIGGWWSAWLSRDQSAGEAAANPLFPPDEKIEPERSGRYVEGAGLKKVADGALSAGDDPIHHLRLFANYLTPRKGLLSKDTWLAAAVVSRNLLLTWLILLPLLFAAVLVGRLYYLVDPGATVHLEHRLRSFPMPEEYWNERKLQHAAITAATQPAQRQQMREQFEARRWWWEIHHRLEYAAWVPAGLLVVLIVLTLAWLGTVQAQNDKAVRKTAGHAGAWRNHIMWMHVVVLEVLVISSAILILAGFGHNIVDYLFTWAKGSGGWTALLSTVSAAIFTSLKAAPSGGEDKQPEPSRFSRIIFAVTPILVLTVLAAGAAWLGNFVLEKLANPELHASNSAQFIWGDSLLLVLFAWIMFKQEGRLAGKARPFLLLAMLTAAGLGVAAILLHRGDGRDYPRLLLAFLILQVLLVAVGWVAALGWNVDPNELSLHAFYRIRLVRAYMGASNSQRRKKHRDITEAAPHDDLSLCDLKNCQRGAPYHLINTTLNLVGGHDLTTAQRHAAYFVFSKHYCGSLRTGYREMKRYMKGNMTLGTAVAISGAAASPNMGAKTPSAALAMLMTLMNVRLGYWAPTPSRDSWRSAQARLWPYYTLREFLSQTNDLGDYCYLTDGGHFENSALYSLIERGCRYIVLLDCGADPRPCFADMGDALRRCRMDFGTKIDLNIDPFGEGRKTAATQHLIVGTITYSAAHLETLKRSGKDDKGILIWIKPILTGDEPADVRQYAIENDNFPQQTTADQWFDEAQFESYRNLGEHSVHEAFEKAVEELNGLAKPIWGAAIKDLFERMQQRYGPKAG